jgi:hypothetical protein
MADISPRDVPLDDDDWVPTQTEPECDEMLNHNIGSLTENLSVLTDRVEMLREWVTQNTRERVGLLGTTRQLIACSRDLSGQSSALIAVAFARFHRARL